MGGGVPQVVRRVAPLNQAAAASRPARISGFREKESVTYLGRNRVQAATTAAFL